MNYSISIFLASLSTIFPLGMSAVETTSRPNYELKDSIRELEEVIIFENAPKAAVTLLPLDVRVIDAATIGRSADANILPVLQSRVPGMFATERGVAGFGVSGGSAGSVAIRGIGGGNRVLFLIDGQPQWAGVFGHSLPDTYVTSDIERVEVVSGPSSLLYGSGAMGGSINLITRRAKADGFKLSLRGMGGSFNTQNYSARVSHNRDGLRMLASGSYDSSAGHRKGMDYWLANQFAAISYDLSKHWEVGGNVMLTETRADNPGSVFREKPLDMWARQFRTTSSLFVKNRYDNSFGGVQVYYNWGKHDIDDGLDKQNKPRAYLFHSKDYNMGMTLYQTIIPWQQNNLSVGVDLKRWGGEAYNTSKSDNERTNIVDKYVEEAASYIMMQQGFFQDNILNINGGIRYEHSSQFGNKWVPQAGVILRPSASDHIKFSYGRGFRSPSIKELYMYAARNPELLPESLDSYEVELRKWFFNGNLSLGAAAYYIDGENLIQTIMDNGAPRNVNTGRFINKGYELDATFNSGHDWMLTANYARLYCSTPIVGAPKHKLFAEASYSPDRWQFSLNSMYIAGLMTEESTETYALLNAKVAYRFQSPIPFTLFVKGKNLTGTRYSINYGFPMPGASVLVGFELSI